MQQRDGPGVDRQDDDTALMRACAAGDRAAFRHIYERWGARLHGLALRITRQPTLAADATHDAFVQVWQQAGRFDPARGNVEAWLVTILRYRALDIVRRTTREVAGYEPADVADDSPDPLAALVGDRDSEALRHCLGELTEDRRRLVVMAFVDGLSHSEMAEKLRMPLGTIKSVIRRSLMLLRVCLEA
jgi:RNA polymerase sigma-70 factor, ECF subfamily